VSGAPPLPLPAADQSNAIWVCDSAQLLDSGLAVRFEVLYFSQRSTAFVLRYASQVCAYLNRCTHVPMEMDYLPGAFFDSSGHWLMCATHGAMYAPQTGHCRFGPCRGGLTAIEVSESEGAVYWHTSDKFQPFPRHDRPS